MTEDSDNPNRRTFVKGAAATGVAATGLGAFGSASAQQDIRNLNVQVSGDGLVNISNVNVLQNVDIDEIAITVIGGDVNINVEDVLQDIDVNVDEVVNVENVDVLTDSVVQVAVAVLGSSGDLVAAGSDAANL